MSSLDRSGLPLSIGYYCPKWPVGGAANGIVTYVSVLTEELKRLGHQTTILAETVAQDQIEPGVYDLQNARAAISKRPINRAFYGLWRRVAAHPANSHLYRRTLVTTMRRAIAERRIEILEMEESFGWAQWLCKTSPIPICVRLHGPWFLSGRALGVPDDRRFRSRVAAEGRAIRAADFVSAPSRDVVEKTSTFYGLDLKHVEITPHPAPRVSERWRLDHADSRLVLFVGRFDRLKGGDLIIDAFVRVLQEVPDAQLWFVGPDSGCSTGDGRTLHIEEYVRDRLPGALESKRVVWLGPQPFEALAALRRRALVSVTCSLYESFSFTVIESLALGCPIVAANVGGIPEIVRDNVNGLLHQPGDPVDLATKIVSLLAAPGRAADLGRQAALDWQRYYHPEVIAARMVDFYRRVLRRASQDPR
jgi:glycosyltransferase involved in cell wall biosynthesis